MKLSCRILLTVSIAMLLVPSLTASAATWNCSTIAQVENAMRGYAAGDEIVLSPGTYVEEAYIRLDRGAVTFRGSTGNRDDVIIQGPGINANVDPKEGVTVISDNVTVKDLTIRGFFWNGLHITGENDTDNTVIQNVKILDCGERYVKGSTNTASSTSIVDNALIENVYMEQLTALSGHPDNNYVGGIDMMGVNAVTIRDCIAKNIRGASAGGRGGIFLWNGINNATVERNQIIGCDRGICIGNPAAPGHAYMPGYHSSGGIVRNNFVTRGAGIGMELCFTNNLKVYYNTIYSADATYFRTVQLYDTAGQTANLQLKYNIIRGVILNSSTGTWSETGDITGSTPLTTWFVNPTAGDLHLTASATGAIDHGAILTEVTEDIDRQARGSLPDVGADETAGVPPVDNVAIGETAVTGTVSGSYVSTQSSNNIYESIREVIRGGGSLNYSWLEHKWTFSVPANSGVTFYLEAYRPTNSDGDNFTFAYSTNGSTWTNMVTVSKASDDNLYQTYALPAGTSGTVYVRVIDTNRTKNKTSLDSIYVDHMFFRSQP